MSASMLIAINTTQILDRLPPSSTASQSQDTSESFIGVLGLLVALVGIVLTALQLRHMQRRKRTMEVYELA
jgi:predicted outer membrane lipoprotein